LAKENYLTAHAFIADQLGCEPIERDNFTDAIDVFLKEAK
jgi:hypothetical protein